MKKTIVVQFVLLTATILVAVVPGLLRAQVTGPCNDCHTMHSSQDAVAAVDGPYETLLIDDCMGCHSSTTADTIKTLGSSSVPVVYNTTPPSTPLAGGNFFWVKEGNTDAADAKGHNIFPLEDDDDLALAPGSAILACGTDSCHLNLNRPYSSDIPPELEGKYGCQGCHLAPAHHADDTGLIIDSAAQGWYRFLSGHDSGETRGVAGIEDDDWQYSKGPSDHNEYLGYEGAKDWYGSFSILQANTMTAFCAGCHSQFHIQQGGDSWIRHPSDAVIPNDREYASAFGATGGAGGKYNPDVPVARQSLTDVSQDVTLDSDMVMCLSCHVPHGSPNDDLLRWNYDDMIAGGGGADGTGCFVCHTTKDGA